MYHLLSGCAEKIRLYEEKGVSTVLVAGSCGAFFHVADTVIQMDRYLPKEITQEAKKTAGDFPLKMELEKGKLGLAEDREIFLPRADERNKIKVTGTDGFLANKKQVDLRYLEQITDGEQMLAIAKALEYLRKKYGGKTIAMKELLDSVMELLRRHGICALSEGSVVPNMAMPRRLEIAGCLNRFISAK